MAFRHFLLTDNGPQFLAKLFETLCLDLKVKHVTTAAYHPQTSAQVERYNKALVARLLHYIADHQNDWDEYV